MKRGLLTLTLISAFLSCGTFAALSASADPGVGDERIFRFGFAAEAALSSPSGEVRFTAENGSEMVYSFEGDLLTVSAKDAQGVFSEVTTYATGESVCLDFWWTGSAYKTRIDDAEYEVNASFGEGVAGKASLSVTGAGITLGEIRDGGIKSRAYVVNDSAEYTDLGDGLYNFKGKVNDSMLVQMEPVKVSEGSVVRVSLAMHGAGNADDNDTWLSLMLGTDIRKGQYGPNETTYPSSGRGPHVALLMRFYKDGHFMGNTFNMGEVAGSIPDISGVSERLECEFRFSASAVSVTLGGVDVGTFAGLPMQSYFSEGAYFNLRTHGTGASKADYDVDVQINDKASASSVNYDLSENASRISVPVRLMGSEITGVYDGDGKLLAPDVCTAENGRILLDASLAGGAEGDERVFYIVSTGGQSRFFVRTTDDTRVSFGATILSYDKASPADLVFSFDKHTLSELSLSSEQPFTGEDYILTDKTLTFKKEYLGTLGYGSYVFALSGRRISGEQSEASAITVLVTDGRSPALENGTFEIDAAELRDLSVGVEWYDGLFTGLKTGADAVETAGYAVNGDGILFSSAYLATLPYGRTEFSLITTENTLEFAIIKSDSREAGIAEVLTVDKADVAEYFDVAGNWYDETVTFVSLDGEQVDYEKTYRAVRLSGKIILSLKIGEHTVNIRTNKRTLTAVLKISDSRVPVRTGVNAFDLAFPSDVEIDFEIYENKLVEVRRGGRTFPSASISEGKVRVGRGWLESMNFTAGAEITFELVWLSPDGETYSATVIVAVVDTRLGDLGSFELGSADSFVFSVNLNGTRIERVRIGGAYVPFEHEEGRVSVPYGALEDFPAGETAVVVETDRYLNEGIVLLVDNRLPRFTEAGEYVSGDYRLGLRTFAYAVVGLSIDGGETDDYTVSDGVLTIGAGALKELSEGNHLLTLTAGAEDGRNFVLSQAFTVVLPRAPEVAAGLTYSLADGGALGVAVDFKNNLQMKELLLEGRKLDTSLWRVVSYGSLSISEGCFKNLAAGVYTFTIVCDRSEGNFTVTVSDSRVNSFLADDLSVNAGAKELAFRAEIVNSDYRVLIDGVETEDYGYKDGILSIGGETVGKLKAGTHVLSLVTAGGEDTLILEVYENSAAVSVAAGAGIGLGVAVVAGIAILAVALKRRKV